MLTALIDAAAPAAGAAREFSWLWSVLFPAATMIISVVLTLWLYRHFSKSGGGE